MRATLAFVFAFVIGGASAGDDLVVFRPAPEVAAAFAKGQPLLETEAYKVHASRRDGPGRAEIHESDTDIIYVLDGSATFVTGGRIVGAETTAAGEIRGSSISAGNTRRLVKGDFAVVPNGVPHWFRDVEGPLLYFVVKVTATEGGGR